jgi:hypothetical protein
MSKLFNLKKWLTIDEAASHLSGVFSESVSSSDVLRLGLDRHLTLSVNFVNEAFAKVGRIVPVEKAKRLPGVPKNSKLGHFQFPGFILNEKEVLEFDDTTETLIGVYDLPLLGGDRLDVEQVYQMITQGPEVTIQEPHGTFVLDSKGRYSQIQEYMDDFDSPTPYEPSPDCKLIKMIDPEERGQWSGQKRREIWKEIVIAQSTEDHYYPAARLPAGSVLVVRPDSLMELIQSVNGAPTSLEKPLVRRERNTLLTIIAVLCTQADISYDKSSKAAGSILSKAAEMGISIGETTIEEHLKKIPDALGTRMK